MSKVIDLKEEKKKRDKKNIIMKIIFIIVAIYIVYAIYLIVKTPNDTITVNTGTLTQEESTTGIIIRDEVIVKGSNYKNGINQIISEGERTSKNQVIFRYYGKSEDELQKKIDDVNLKIQDALKKSENSIFSVDAKNLEKQIDNHIESLSNQTDIQKISEIKKNLSATILKKAIIIGEASQSGSYIKKLVSQREQYEKELEEDSEYIKSPKSGVVSYRVDGYEETLGVNNLENLNSKDLDELDLKTGKIVSASNEEAKIVDNFGCYLATTLSSDTAMQAEVGDKVNITLSSSTEVTASIYSIKEENDKRFIIFKINNLSEELIAYRKVSFNITWWSYSGIKVPNEAIIDGENDLKYVVVKTATGKNKVLVKILKKNENSSIIGKYSAEDLKNLGIDSSSYKGINVYDTILMYP